MHEPHPRRILVQLSHKIVLIDGARLAELMIDYGVGVSTRETYVLKRADEDYFFISIPSASQYWFTILRTPSSCRSLEVAQTLLSVQHGTGKSACVTLI